MTIPTDNPSHAHMIQTLGDKIEGFIDTHNLADVLEAISFVCTEKAEHLRFTWQDYSAAREWDHMSGVLFNAMTAADKRSL